MYCFVAYFQVTTEEERVKFTEQLIEGEDWLYGDGETADAAAFTAKLKELQVVGKPITLRASEAELRPEVSRQGFVVFRTAWKWGRQCGVFV